jgi:hypothetical protein
MVLRLVLLAAVAALLASESWLPPDLPDTALDLEEIAVLVAAALGADSLRLRR